MQKPAKHKITNNEYKDIHTTLNKEALGLMDSEYDRLQ